MKKQNLLLADFFEVEDLPARQADVIVGNPPFIRYQRFSGEARQVALVRAASHGVQLNELSSSWAPFIIHSSAMIKPGGRLAMVAPMELVHAAYALPVLDYLSKSFAAVTFLTFKKKLFPDLNENTLLLLAEDKGPHRAKLTWRDLPHAGLLAEMQQGQPRVRMGNRRIDTSAFSQGQERLIEYFIPKKARELYRELKLSRATRRLGELADVGIGYVTGANEFFHLTLDAVRAWGIPTTFLKPSIRRSRALAGLRFTQADWRKALEAGEACYLLAIEAKNNLPKSVRQYLEHGKSLGVCRAYKCRTRSPWFRVPHVYHPDAFLTYMSGETPRLVANETEAVAPNSLHILRLRPHTKLASDVLAALWQTSLTRLSAEIEGHALGGGMLKLEPTEAERVVVPAGDGANGKLAELVGELDKLARNGENAVVQTQADQVLLRDGLGLSQSDCQLLKKAAEALCRRRHFRSAAA